MSEHDGGVEAKAEPDADGAATPDTVDRWHARLDRTMVHIDLAGHEVRDRLRKQRDLAENVYLAARSRLSGLGGDSRASIENLRQGTGKLVGDLQGALKAAEAAFHRGRAE